MTLAACLCKKYDFMTLKSYFTGVAALPKT